MSDRKKRIRHRNSVSTEGEQGHKQGSAVKQALRIESEKRGTWIRIQQIDWKNSEEGLCAMVERELRGLRER